MLWSLEEIDPYFMSSGGGFGGGGQFMVWCTVFLFGSTHSFADRQERAEGHWYFSLMGPPQLANSVPLHRRLLVMGVVLPQPGPMLYDWEYVWGLEGLDGGGTLPAGCYDLHLQSVVGGRPQI